MVKGQKSTETRKDTIQLMSYLAQLPFVPIFVAGLCTELTVYFSLHTGYLKSILTMHFHNGLTESTTMLPTTQIHHRLMYLFR